MEHGVGYGYLFHCGDASQPTSFSIPSLRPQKPASGGVYVLEMLDGSRPDFACNERYPERNNEFAC